MCLITHTDHFLLEVTLSLLEQNVKGIMQTQEKILSNQDKIFDRLRDLEQKYRVLSDVSASHQSSSTSAAATCNYSYPTCKSLFPVTAPSPEWYRECADDYLSPFPSHPPQSRSQVALLRPTPQIQPDFSSHAPVTPRSHLPMQQPLRANQAPPSTTSQHIQSLTAPTLPLPLQKNKGITLESAAIDKSTLQPVAVVVEKYKKLKTVGSAGTLAVKLARECFFGEDVLAKCTVYGARDKPALPSAELAQLKQAMFNLFPQFWQSPIQFEPVWNACVISINQCNKGLRSKVSLASVQL